MKHKENLYGIAIFALTCILLAGQMLRLISISIPVILGAALMLYSFPSMYIAVEKGKRMRIILSAFLFFTGLIIIIVKIYSVFEPLKVVFPSIVFVTGIIFILLYIENNREKSFLYAGIITAALGIASVYAYGHFAVFYFTDKIISFLAGYWHLILIFAGIMLLMNRKRK